MNIEGRLTVVLWQLAVLTAGIATLLLKAFAG